MKRLANTYVKYVAKKPVLFLALIVVNIIIIVVMTLVTKTNVVTTYDIIMDKNKIIVDEVIDPSTDYLYVYSNRNEYVYRLEIIEKECDEDSTIFYVNELNDLEFLQKVEIQADIPVVEISLFDRIFLRGGRVNE